MGRERVTSSVAGECFSHSATVNRQWSAIKLDRRFFEIKNNKGDDSGSGFPVKEVSTGVPQGSLSIRYDTHH